MEAEPRLFLLIVQNRDRVFLTRNRVDHFVGDLVRETGKFLDHLRVFTREIRVIVVEPQRNRIREAAEHRSERRAGIRVEERIVVRRGCGFRLRLFLRFKLLHVRPLQLKLPVLASEILLERRRSDCAV